MEILAKYLYYLHTQSSGKICTNCVLTCINASPTIQDALGKDKSQYPHAPLRSISKLMLFLLLSALFLLVIPSFYFFNKSIAMKEKGACKSLSLPPSVAPSLSLSILHVGRKMKRRRFELLPAADCLLVQRETVCDPQLCVSPFRTIRTVPHRASVQPCRRVGALLCVEHEGARLGALRSR